MYPWALFFQHPLTAETEAADETLGSKLFFITIFYLWVACAVPVLAQDQDYAKVKIKTKKVAHGIYMLMCKGLGQDQISGS